MPQLHYDVYLFIENVQTTKYKTDANRILRTIYTVVGNNVIFVQRLRVEDANMGKVCAERQ